MSTTAEDVQDISDLLKAAERLTRRTRRLVLKRTRSIIDSGAAGQLGGLRQQRLQALINKVMSDHELALIELHQEFTRCAQLANLDQPDPGAGDEDVSIQSGGGGR